MKNVRIMLGLTQAELADELAVSVRTVQNYEQGRRDINRASMAVRRNWDRIKASVSDG